MSRTRKNYNSSFKTKVVLEILKERETAAEIARKYRLHQNQISQWKKQFIENAGSVFETKGESGRVKEAKQKEERYLKTIGQLKMDVDFLKEALSR